MILIKQLSLSDAKTYNLKWQEQKEINKIRKGKANIYLYIFLAAGIFYGIWKNL